MAFNYTGIKHLRRDRDSNPGTPNGVNGFRDRPIQPLWHLSKHDYLCYQKYKTLFSFGKGY